MKKCTECGAELKSNKKVMGIILAAVLVIVIGVVVLLSSQSGSKIETLRDTITWEEDEEKVNAKVEEFKGTNIEQYGNRTIGEVFTDKNVKQWKAAQVGDANYISVIYVELETEFEVLINVTDMTIEEYYIADVVCEEARMINLVAEIVENLDKDTELVEMKAKAEAEAKAKEEAEAKAKEEAEAKAKAEAEAKAKAEAEKFIGKNGQYGSGGATLNVEVSDKTITAKISVGGDTETMKGKVLANNKAVVYLEAGEAITLVWKNATTVQVTAENGFHDDSIAFIRMICEALNNQEYKYK